jgi:hypothetical protein
MSEMILGIDPGTTHSAAVWWNGEAVECYEYLENSQLIATLNPNSAPPGILPVAIEMIASYGMPVGRETFETVRWIGKFQQHIIHCGYSEPELLYRKDIKLHLCGSMRAKDANVRQALIDRFGAPGTKGKPGALYGIKSHGWAALAVAVTAWDQLHKSE